MNIKLTDLNRAAMHEFFRGFEYDADTFSDMEKFGKYSYDKDEVDRRYEKCSLANDRKYFYILADGKTVGEIYLKNIDEEKKQAEIAIHLANDDIKNKGVGTEAEKLLISYAFDIMGLDTLFADTLIKNTRSAHVLEKVGFDRRGEDKTFIYYRLTREKYEKHRAKEVLE